MKNYQANVTLLAADQRDLKRGVLATVIIDPEEKPVTNRIEQIATDITNVYFPKIFPNARKEKNDVENHVRWIEVRKQDKYTYGLFEVRMDWDKKHHCYQRESAEWKTVSPSSWYYPELVESVKRNHPELVERLKNTKKIELKDQRWAPKIPAKPWYEPDPQKEGCHFDVVADLETRSFHIFDRYGPRSVINSVSLPFCEHLLDLTIVPHFKLRRSDV